MEKSQFKGIILTLILGPLGLFYSSVTVGAVLVVAASIIGFLSGEVPLGLWPISIIVSIFTVRRHNLKAKQELLAVGLAAANVGQEPIDVEEVADGSDLTESRKSVAGRLPRMADGISEEEIDFSLDDPGHVDGKHFTAYVDQVRQLKREQRHDEAIALMLKLIGATEAESKDSGGNSGVAPWYYEQLAIIYRKEKRLADEIAILERYARQTKAPGVGPQRLAERLTIATEKMANEGLSAEKEDLETVQAKLGSRRADIGTERTELESWRVEVERSEAGRQAEQTRQEAKNNKPPLPKKFESQPKVPIVGTGKIAELLRKAKTKNAKSQSSEIGLVEFRISRTQEFTERRETSNRQPGRWIQPSEKVTINKFEIRRGFFYFGGHLKGLDQYYFDNDPSLIDSTLTIDSRSPDYAGDQMDYYPSYSRITPQSRSAYLEWLASDRTDPETYIGYVFLYFYGIERRLLIDETKGQVSDDERKALIQELKRLKNIYGDNRSFNSYVTALLSHIWILNNRTLDEKPDHSLLVAKRGFTAAFKFLLAQTVQAGKPINAELALAWVKSHPEFTLRTPARRCQAEFDELFKFRYRSKFGDGLEITPNKTRLQLDYQPASASLRGYQSLKLDLPDVSRLRGPVSKLFTLAESCTGELDQFSRYVGRPGNSHDSLSAISLLPNDLIPSVSYPRLDNFRAWVKIKVPDSSGLVSVESILQQFGEDAPLKINKKEAAMLSNIAEKAGFGIAPDVRFHHAKPDIEGNVVLFSRGHGEGFNPSAEFRRVGTVLRLGALVATTDGHISDSEVSALKRVIAEGSRLSETEKRSLDAYMLWHLNSPANMTGLKKRLDLLSTSEKVAISHILVSVALSDGRIDPTEIRQLEKLYTQLGLEKGMVASDIHNLSSSRLPRPGRASERVPSEPIEPDGDFVLDRELLRRIEEETKEAQSVLESIFADEGFDDEHEAGVPPEAPSKNGSIAGLDEQHQQLYVKLISKSQWNYEEVEELCKSLQLMTDGAVETINDWAFENVDAPLIEDGSTVYVDIELVDEIAAMQGQKQLP